MNLFTGILLRSGIHPMSGLIVARIVRQTGKAIYLERVDVGVRGWFPIDALVPIAERVGEYRLRRWFIAMASADPRYRKFFASVEQVQQW